MRAVLVWRGGEGGKGKGEREKTIVVVHLTVEMSDSCSGPQTSDFVGFRPSLDSLKYKGCDLGYAHLRLVYEVSRIGYRETYLVLWGSGNRKC